MAARKKKPKEQVGASISSDVDAKLRKFIGKTRIKAAVVEEAISEYLESRAVEDPRGVIHFELDADTAAQLADFRKDNYGGAPANVARHALRLLLDMEPASKEFVVRLSDPNLVDRFDRYRASKKMNRSIVTESALDEYLKRRGGNHET